jgi:hypothetical protein
MSTETSEIEIVKSTAGSKDKFTFTRGTSSKASAQSATLVTGIEQYLDDSPDFAPETIRKNEALEWWKVRRSPTELFVIKTDYVCRSMGRDLITSLVRWPSTTSAILELLPVPSDFSLPLSTSARSLVLRCRSRQWRRALLPVSGSRRV